MCERALVERGYAVTIRDWQLTVPVEATERVLGWRDGPTPGGVYNGRWSVKSTMAAG
ncbi:hypothetical protein [Haloarcula sp. K1]|uniref:hypothetical protein n=1 Tax=Haloarcula sp. K1 TaxID=1622207 RepID=UPI000ACAC788|nr:hypothetical protein [Haloarcula sp. K1]